MCQKILAYNKNVYLISCLSQLCKVVVIGDFMSPEEIYQALKNRSLNVAMIAESLGVSNQAVSSVIKKGKNSQRIAKAISIAIDKPLDQVFPHYIENQQKKAVRAEKITQLKRKFAQI